MKKDAMSTYKKPKALRKKGGGKGLPMLKDLKVPPKGLLDPSLRKDMGPIKGIN